MMHLMTTLWKTKTEGRGDELYRCFQKNLENPHIDRITVLWESQDSPPEYTKHEKVCIVPVTERPKFGDYFRYANENLEGKIIVANSDIYFDDTIALAKDADFSNSMWCITRHNHLLDGRIMPQGLDVGVRNYYTQDVWIFQAPIKEFDGWGVMLGVLGCDSHFAGLAANAGFRLRNPCLSIICHHIHNIGERNDQPGGKSYWNDPHYSPREVRWEHL